MFSRCKRSVFFLMVVLLCSACSPASAPSEPVLIPAPVIALPAPIIPEPAAPAAPSPVATPSNIDMRGWWERPEVLAGLGLTAAEGAALTPELHKLERNYQVAQRQLRTIRRTQLQMLRDPKVPSADIRRFHVRNLQSLLTTMLDQNIAARLWVREHLKAEQLARIRDLSPQFFAARWFRAARIAEPAEPQSK